MKILYGAPLTVSVFSVCLAIEAYASPISANLTQACSPADCHEWASFCDEWDDQQRACYYQCEAFCQREDLCHDAAAQERAADATDLDSACPM